VPNADAELVRRIYAMYIGGLGVRGICTQLNAEGIKTPRGTQWSCHPMSHILRNRLYTGWIDYGARDSKKHLRPEGPTLTAKGEHEPILDVATWEQAQTVMARRKSLPSRSASGEYPLTGVTRCGLCGAAIRGMKRKRGRTAVKFYRREYRCHRQTNSGTCTMQTLMGNRLEQAVLVALSQWVDGDKLRAMLENADNGDGDSATRELAEIERRLTRWSAAYEAGAIELPEYQAKVSPLRERKRILGDELQTKASHPQHRTLDDWRIMAHQLQAVWPEATPAERKELMHSTGLRFTVHPGYVVELG
jgi:site-specific DNA recombinase